MGKRVRSERVELYRYLGVSLELVGQVAQGSYAKIAGGQLSQSCRMHFAGLVTTMSSPPVNFTCWTGWDNPVKF